MPAHNDPRHPVTAIPAHIKTIADYGVEATRHLTEDILAYLEGGAMNECSLRQNLASYLDIKLLPRHLNDLRNGHTQCNILGETYDHPIFLAPIAYQKLFHPDGELATALAAEVMQSNMIVSAFSTTTLDAIAQHSSGPKWFQLYWQTNRENSLALLRLAENSGYKAIVVTVDAPHAGIRDRERAINFKLPSHLSAVNLTHSPSLPNLTENQHALFDGLMAVAPQWQDIEWIAKQTSLPIILKGILHPADAALAIQYGAQGIIISNHGGRILDTAISPIEVLPAIRKIVPIGFPLLIDSGIRRGTDIFKAIALGASAVMIGRPYIYGLSVAGSLGAAHVIRILKEELEVTMALCGTSNLNDITSDYVLCD